MRFTQKISRDIRVKPGYDTEILSLSRSLSLSKGATTSFFLIMKCLRFFILTFFLSLLCTSCLADILNEKFGYTQPIYVSYSSEYGKVPSKKEIEKGTALTAEYLPELSSEDYQFNGWFLDKNFYNQAQEGYIVNKSITLYANWIYTNYSPEPQIYLYEVHNRFFDPDFSENGFLYNDTYTLSFTSLEDAAQYQIYVSGYEYIPAADTTYTYQYSYDASQEASIIFVIEKYFYKTNISAYNLYSIGNYLNNYDNFTYTFYITDYNPNLSISISNPPYMALHLEACTGLTEIPYGIFSNSHWLKEIYLPNSISKIDSMAFAYCSNLKYISLNDGITELGNSCFNYCSSLESINIPNSVSALGDYLFSNCLNLKTITLPVFIREIPFSCFDNCISLESIQIPKQVETISSYAFQGCSLLKEIYLPFSLKMINSSAFENCTNLQDVYYEASAAPTTLQIIDETMLALRENNKWHYNSY